MDKPLNAPGNAFQHKGQDKDKHFKAQMKKVFASFQRKPSTMLMVAVETGILRANICRYIAQWQRQGKIQLIKMGICPISKHRAGFYTTSPDLFMAIAEPSKASSHE